MLRIIHAPSIPVTTIHLEGKLLQPWVAEVQISVDAARRRGLVRLNLSQLQFVDDSGLQLIRNLQQDGVELSGVPALIAGLMASAGNRRA